MSQKYIPPSMRRKTNSWVTPSTTVQNDFQSNNSSPSLVNTSLPAKQAPKLTPSTLASLTSKNKDSNKNNTQVTDDDFPSLGSLKKSLPETKSVSYANLARDWGKKQQDDAEKKKQEAIIEAEQRERERKRKEEEERDRRRFGIGIIKSSKVMPLSRYNDSDDDKEYDLGGNKKNTFDDGYSSYDSNLSDPNDDVYSDENDDENSQDEDDDLNNRRSKYELY